METVGSAQPEKGKLSSEHVTEIVVTTLLCVYDSHADLAAEDLVDTVWSKTGFDHETTSQVVERMFDKKYNYLQQSDDPEHGTVFGAPGLWLLEDALMNGETSVDPMATAEHILTRTRFISTD